MTDTPLVEPSVPEVDDIDARWLSAALSGRCGPVNVAAFERSPVGAGQVGDTYRYILTYAAGRGPATLIAKHHSANADSRAVAKLLSLNRNECGFYAELAQSSGVTCAKPYYVGYDNGDDRFVLLLEDIAPARVGDQLQGLSETETRLAVIEAAKLHASHWGDDRLSQRDWINVAPRAQGVVGAEGTKPFIAEVVERFSPYLTDEQVDVIRCYGDGCHRWNRPLDLPRSITHNDFRPDNFLFGTGDQGKPITIVDWQTMSFHYGPLDVAYLIGGGATGADRHRIEQALLPEYHDGLLAGGVRDFTLDQCWDCYRYFTFAGLTVAIVASMSVKRTERGDRLFGDMMARHALHAIEHDALRYLAE